MRQVRPPFLNSVHTFQAGNIANCLDEWGKYTTDPWVLGQAQGVTIPFTEIEVTGGSPYALKFNPEESDIIDLEIEKLSRKKVIQLVDHEEGQVISNIFLRPKKNGEYRMVLDLSKLNKAVEYQHFKMTSLKSALELMREDAWMASVDLKDAYYSVPIQEQDRKYLRFMWRGALYQFNALPNGLACAPRFFTKLLTPVFSELRRKGNECFFYIDDSFVIADTQEHC